MQIKNNGISLSLTDLTKIKRKQTLQPMLEGMEADILMFC